MRECGRSTKSLLQHKEEGELKGVEPSCAFAVCFYTLDTCQVDASCPPECNFFREYNRLLVRRDNKVNAALQGYSYFLLTGLRALPAWKGSLFRGISRKGALQHKVREVYKQGRSVHWSSFTSCSTDPQVAVHFAGGKKNGGVLFRLEVRTGRNIQALSAVPQEAEILLEPNFGLFVVRWVAAQDSQYGLAECVLVERDREEGVVF